MADKEFAPLNISERNDAWNKLALEISREIRSVPKREEKAPPPPQVEKSSGGDSSSQ